MDNRDSLSKKVINQFGRMWLDSLLSLQPSGTYRIALNAVNASDEENSFGLVNEGSTEFFVDLPGEIRGMIYVEERNQYVVFVDTEAGGEIGIIGEDRRTYKSVTNTDIAPELGICQDQWIDTEVKIVQPCNNLYLYWSSGDVYKRLNLDDPCCEFEDIELIKPVCIGEIKTGLVDRGGGLPNGIYQFAAKATDTEGNDSNWSKISNPISVSDGDHKPGERSDKAINIRIEGVDNRDYHLLDLAVISTIDGVTTIEQFATISANNDTASFNYLYTGKTGREFPIELSDILTRTNRYIRGKNLVQYDNRLVLYNLRPIANLDYQLKANEIKTEYETYVVPLEFADQFKSLRHNENYQFAISWNYSDGTRSKAFIIPGREDGPEPCDEYVDNSERLETFFDLVPSDFVKTTGVDYDPTRNAGDGLTEDEGTAVELDPSDEPTIGGEIEGALDEVEYMDFEMGAATDCLCEAAKDIAEKGDLTSVILGNIGGTLFGVNGSWELEDDVIGALALAQIICMCNNRETNVRGDNGRDREPEPGGDDDGGGLQGGGPISGLFSDDDVDALEQLGVDTSLTFEEAGISNSTALRIFKNLQNNGVVTDPITSMVCDNGTCTNCGSSCSSTGGSNNTGTCSNSSCAASNGYRATSVTVSGKTLQRPVDYLRKRIASHAKAFQSETSVLQNKDLQSNDIIQGGVCNKEGYRTCVNNICYECRNGRWYHLNNLDNYNVGVNYTSTQQGDLSTLIDLGFNKLYAEDGCTVIGIEPKKYSRGLFGGWKTNETYPYTLNCDCDYIYGDLAGEKVRLHKVPSTLKEPHFVSFSSGTPSKYDQANSEFKDTYVVMVGPKFFNIKFPEKPPKPLCKHNPYSILYVERTESNKTVIGSGIGHSCFLGEVEGENYAFPKHGVNSFERFDRHIEPSGSTTFRGGTRLEDGVGAYFIHSPDFHLRRPALDADLCLFEQEIYGQGFRHGMFAEGEKPENISQDRLHQKGTRQSVNLNKYALPEELVVRPVKAMSIAPANSIVSKANSFTYNLSNLHRESGVYMELDDDIGIQPFSSGDGGIVGGASFYGGSDRRPDGASDRSFTGDTFTESLPIHDAKAHYMTFVRRLPNQYGSVINQAFIPLGLEASKFGQESIGGLRGDSFIGTMTYKRVGLISDKTNRIISRFVSTGGFDSSDGFVRRILGRLLATMFRVLGIKNGGYIPKNQDASDYIRVFGGLRDINDRVRANTDTVSNPGEITAGNVPPPYPTDRDRSMEFRVVRPNDINFGDNYFPQNLKTQITSHFNADVNLKYRQINSVDGGEVYYSSDAVSLRGLNLDSSIPVDSKWEKGWLNRWYSEWKENAKWKLIIQAVFTFLFTYMIGLWLLVKGIGYVVTGLQAAGGGTYGMQTIGALIAVAFGVVLVFLAIIWIRFWVSSDVDNKLIEELAGIKNVRPDLKNADGSYSFNENRLLQFEDNYFRLDNTHSIPNRYEVTFSMSDPYNTCTCPTDYHNKIIYSERQIGDSDIDFWRNYKPLNNLEIPTEHGKIQKMFRMGNSLFAHTTDMLMHLHRGGGGFSFAQDDILLGTGNLFGLAAPIRGGVVEGYAGLKDPNAAHVTSFGYIFPDRESRKWYSFTGQSLNPISNSGVKHFMDENMTLQLLNKFPDFKLVDLKLKSGIGFSFGVDHENARLLFTKIDYKPISDKVVLNEDGVTFSVDGENVPLGDPRYFNDESFTLSYSFYGGENGSWVSFHSYKPVLYAWNRFDMYSFAKDKMWKHNVKGNFQTFYGTYFPYLVEYVINDIQESKDFEFTSSTIGTEAYKWNGYTYVRSNYTFDQLLAYNSRQASGVLDVFDTGDMNILERSTQQLERVEFVRRNKTYTFNDIYSSTIDENEPIFDPIYNKIYGNPFYDVNNSNIDFDSNNNSFIDDYLVNRLIFSKFDDTKLLIKRVDSELKYEGN